MGGFCLYGFFAGSNSERDSESPQNNAPHHVLPNRDD
jgi:hypothetical protein